MTTLRNLNETTNPLIVRHQNAHDDSAPMPNDYADATEFLVAHKAWLVSLRKDNKRVMARNFGFVRKHKGDGMLFGYLSKIIHFRKEYDAFLVRGIDAVSAHIARGR